MLNVGSKILILGLLFSMQALAASNKQDSQQSLKKFAAPVLQSQRTGINPELTSKPAQNVVQSNSRIQPTQDRFVRAPASAVLPY